MKKSFFAFALLLITGFTYSQSLPDFESYPLNTPENITKANPIALQAATYLLTNPINKNVAERQQAISYLFKWMDATSDYTFEVESSIAILGDDTNYTGLYIAAMSKYQIENNITDGGDNTKIETWKIIAAYVSDPDNHVKVKGKLKKLVEANKENKLNEFLDKYSG